ncbi:MAG: tRNA (adenosine(37)-N6)-dimethylallyltransferase MiaA [Thermoanaerobaculia bacterium]
MPSLIALVGPTAVGKSALALELARELDAEILNGDALQVYQGLDIGTAKPTAAEQAQVPHHLIDILTPDERYSAGEFARRAREVLEDLERRGKRGILVGGSGLYYRALLEGLSPIPPGDPEVRQALRVELGERGLPALVAELARVDPRTAERLPAGDTQRVLRALEVARVSGRPLSAWIEDKPLGWQQISALRIGLTLPRSILYHRIQGRTTQMFQSGWVGEVEALLARGWQAEMPAFQAIGYRQIVGHLQGAVSLDSAVEETIRATRHFAKRQGTWFRKEAGIMWFDAQNLKSLKREVGEFLRANGVGGEVDA